jgi:hypothetical protein
MTGWKKVLSLISPPTTWAILFLEALLLIIAHPCIFYQRTFIIHQKSRNEYQVCKG